VHEDTHSVELVQATPASLRVVQTPLAVVSAEQ
jgi:hypothetical protein